MEQSEYQNNHRISILSKEVEAAEASKANFNAEKEALLNEVRGMKLPLSDPNFLVNGAKYVS